VFIVLIIIFISLYQQLKYEKVINFCIENNLTDKLIKKYPDIKENVINELKYLEKEKIYNEIDKKYQKGK
jgi:hypothetical protein